MKAKKKIYPRIYTGELTENGKRIRKRLPPVKTKKQALKARKDYYSKKRKPGKNTKFYIYCDYWLERKVFKEDSSREMYNMVIKKHIKPFFGDKEIGSIKKFDVEKFKKKLLDEKHFSTHYINMIITVLRQLFNDAWKNDFILSPPTKALEIFKYKKKDINIPNYDECLRIANILKNSEKYKFPLLFGWYAGLRRGEALGVRWEDINLKENVINVSQQIVVEAGRIVCKPPKRDEIRTVPIAAPLRAELVKVPIEERKGLVYRNIRSKNPRAFNDYFRKYIKPQIGIKRFHDFRHINISKLLSSPSVSIDMIKNMAGHSSINTTTQIYGHKTSEEINKIRDTLNEKLG